jgi:hypothetical protein
VTVCAGAAGANLKRTRRDARITPDVGVGRHPAPVPTSTTRRCPMICFLSARRLKPGAYDDFRRSWEPERWPSEAIRAFHLRRKDDENLVVSFGLYEGTLSDYERIRDEHGDDERRLDRIAEHVDETIVEGVFEVVDELAPASA